MEKTNIFITYFLLNENKTKITKNRRDHMDFTQVYYDVVMLGILNQ